MAHKSETELAEVDRETREQVEVGGKYFHYKNLDKFYTVLVTGFIEATEEPCVVYKAEYGENLVWIRSLEEWSSIVEHEGKQIPRFQKAS